MRPTPTDVKHTFARDELIVSKTDLQGKILYANDVFVRLAGYSRAELVGAPHSIIRHPDMPRAVFALLWQTLESGSEIFAYVKNLSQDGGYYWVLAHVTPSFSPDGRIVGYHSSRRVPSARGVAFATELYQELLACERRQPDKASQVRAGMELLNHKLASAGMPYAQLIFELEKEQAA